MEIYPIMIKALSYTDKVKKDKESVENLDITTTGRLAHIEKKRSQTRLNKGCGQSLLFGGEYNDN